MKVGIVILAAIFVLGAEAGKKNGRRRIRCSRVKCESDCRKVRSENGCYTCECEPPCAIPDCEPGCVVQETFHGPCPECDCEKDQEIEVKKPVCAPPKCEPGCSVQDTFDGPCPGCECKEIDEVKDVNPTCGITECDSHCTLQTVYEGSCPECECRSVEGVVYIVEGSAVCPPLKCPPDCPTEVDSLVGPCRFCSCKTYQKNCKLVPDVSRKDEQNVVAGGEFLMGGFNDDNARILCYRPPECPKGNKIDAIFEGPCPICMCTKEDKDEDK